MIRDSVEYLEFTLTDRDAADLSSDEVQVTLFDNYAAPPDPLEWIDCTHLTGNTWRTSDVITWSAADYPATQYRAYAKVTDDPETPLCSLGTVVIQGI